MYDRFIIAFIHDICVVQKSDRLRSPFLFYKLKHNALYAINSLLSDCLQPLILQVRRCRLFAT